MDSDQRSKGYGIIEFESHDALRCAIETLHDADVDGRRVVVREYTEDRDAVKKRFRN